MDFSKTGIKALSTGLGMGLRNSGISLITVLALAGCAANGPSATSSASKSGLPASEADKVAQLQIVDCLLPGQLRSLGKGTYLTARRPIKTTAADCNIRGGEYTAYDRADYKTALKVWMPAAEAGDAKAQVSVGEIFEKGLGTEPNYEAAVIWYKKAAEQGNKQGLFNLGTMYEQGNGVPENRVKALNLYRQAWGLPEDSVIFQETARAEQAALRDKLSKQLEEKQSQIRLLRQQIDSLQKKLQTASSQARTNSTGKSQMASEIASLKQLVDSLSESREQDQQELASLPKLREPAASPATASSGGAAPPAPVRSGGMDFGQYHALVIGNRDYRRMEPLDTPVNDARDIASILQQRYGFSVQLLIDANRLTIMKTINDLHERLGENDNLLVYYAGHGSLLEAGKGRVGYWLPINADPPPDDSFWVPNEFVTGHLGRLNAKRVLVIADSCYGGLLSSAPGFLMLGDNSKNVSEEYIRYKLPRRSRLLLSSGGNKPVVDSIGDRHSIFAEELIKVLSENDSVLTVPELFARIEGTVRTRSARNNFDQQPVLKSIKGAGHEIGDFFFVPKTADSVAMR